MALPLKDPTTVLDSLAASCFSPDAGVGEQSLLLSRGNVEITLREEQKPRLWKI